MPEAAIPWNAYSPSAEVTGEVLYVNYGRPEDYERLKAMGVDARGKIVLARYSHGYRGGKALEAEKRGALAILVYSDPIEDGWFRGPVYPAGPWGPAAHLQRGVQRLRLPRPRRSADARLGIHARRQADPDGRGRKPAEDPDDAALVPRTRPRSSPGIGGRPVPDAGWQGLAVADTFRVGPGPVRVHLKIENTRERRTIRNVIATLRGSELPEKKVLLSNHFDAWIYGGVDPSSGTASMLALARALGRLARRGISAPADDRHRGVGRRGVHAHGLDGMGRAAREGSPAERRRLHQRRRVGPRARVRGFGLAPPLDGRPRGRPGFPGPSTPGKSLADTWRAADQRKELPVAILGSGSDYTVFFNHLGIASVDLVFDGPYGVYHSVYDTHRWMATQGDPGFVYHAAMAKYAGMLALRFANADMLPFDAAAYGREVAKYAEELQSLPGAESLRPALKELASRGRRLERCGRRGPESRSTARLAAGEDEALRLRDANAWLLSLERSLIDPPGIPGRPWFRHLVYAPLPSYEAETLPAVREAVESGAIESAGLQIQRLSERLATAAASARKAESLLRPKPKAQ